MAEAARAALIPPLEDLHEGRGPGEVLAAQIRAYAAEHPGRIEILEAGCGGQWNLDVSGIDYRLTGVDLDAKAVELRQQRHGDLDEAIIGDLTTVPLPEAAFDIVYCSFVLEHVHGAEQVLDRLLAATKPGGLLLLKIPDRDSAYGFLARTVPHRAHVWYKRYFERRKDAGKPGHGPHPTVYDRVVSGRGIQDWCERRGLSVVTAGGSKSHLRYLGALAPVGDGALRLLAAGSLGRLVATHNNLTFVIAKPATTE